jgi:hypothetical protein
MPAATIHRCVAKKILEMTNLYTNDEDKFLFEVGCIAPDSWKNTKRFKNSTLPKKQKRCYSHFSPKDKYIELYLDFYTKYNPKKEDAFMVGYLVHLMTDFFWRYLIFYNYFNKDGSVKLINGLSINGEKGVRKTLLKNETMKIVTYLAKEYELKELDHLSSRELSQLPVMDEIEFDGLNEAIDYDNNEATNDFKYELMVYKVSEFKNGITKCSNIIIGELANLGIIDP